jgi:hypothetical protein
MRPLTIKNRQQALTCLLETKKTRQTTKNLSGTAFIEVTELARNRYGYQVPVWISQTAYQRCVTEPAERISGNDHGESLWLFKVLALAKYAIQQCAPGATLTTFVVALNDHKLSPTTEPLKVLVCGDGQQPVLLIKHVSEVSTDGLDQLLDDLGSIESIT